MRCFDRTSVYFCTSPLQNHTVSQDFYSPLSISLERSGWPRIRWCGIGGFQEQDQGVFVGLVALSSLVFNYFPFLFFPLQVGSVGLGSSDSSSCICDAETCVPEWPQLCWGFESRESETAVTRTPANHSALSRTPAMITRECLRTARLHLSGLLSLFSSKHTQLLYIAICIQFEERLNEIWAN